MGDYQPVFQNCGTTQHSHSNEWGIQFFLSLIMLVIAGILAMLVCMKQYAIYISISIFLMINIEYLL